MYSDTRIAHGPILFISGQTPQQEAETPDDIYTQTKIVLHKIQIILQQHEIDWSSIGKMTVFITDAADLSGLREAFTDILGETKPAMSLVVVAGLIDPSFKVEIDAQAELPFKR
ncbi:RidA family protein [Enterococcus sp. N342-3-1-2]